MGSGLTRRRVLAAIGGAGLAGSAGGFATSAVFNDVERVDRQAVTAGSLDLRIECAGQTCRVEDGTVSVELSGITPGDSGVERFTLTTVGNPAWAWLGTSCPEPGLAEAVEVEVRVDEGCDGTVEEVAAGTLREVLLALRSPVRLGDGCLRPDDRTCVEFSWGFPVQPGVEAYEGATAAFELRFASVQCRHTDGSVPPIDLSPCDGAESAALGLRRIEVWTCPTEEADCECQPLGLVDVSAGGCQDQVSASGRSAIRPGVYDLTTEGCAETGYDLHVTETQAVNGETVAVAFEVLGPDGSAGPDLCQVTLETAHGTHTLEPADLGERSNTTDGLVGVSGA